MININSVIFVSTANIPSSSVIKSVDAFVESGITNIELSGGNYENNLLRKLTKYKNVSYQIHHYFPPPIESFVINLASTNQDIAVKSIEHIKNAIKFSALLSIPIYSIHAGYLIDPEEKELGKKINVRPVADRNKCLEIFIAQVNKLAEYSKKFNVKLLLENNVISQENHKEFKMDPLLMTNSDEIIYVMKKTSENVGLLLDIGHLNVSAATLGFDAEQAVRDCYPWTLAYHLSENNGLADDNLPVKKDSWFWNCLKKQDISYYSLEVYNSSVSELKKQIDLVKSKIYE